MYLDAARAMVLPLPGPGLGPMSAAASADVPASRSMASPPLPEGLAAWLGQGAPAQLPDLHAVREVGARYVAAHPDEADLALLWHRFIASGAHRGDAALVAQIGQDWCRGDIAVLAGWVFARTEARYCALLFKAGLSA